MILTTKNHNKNTKKSQLHAMNPRSILYGGEALHESLLACINSWSTFRTNLDLTVAHTEEEIDHLREKLSNLQKEFNEMLDTANAGWSEARRFEELYEEEKKERRLLEEYIESLNTSDDYREKRPWASLSVSAIPPPSTEEPSGIFDLGVDLDEEESDDSLLDSAADYPQFADDEDDNAFIEDNEEGEEDQEDQEEEEPQVFQVSWVKELGDGTIENPILCEEVCDLFEW